MSAALESLRRLANASVSNRDHTRRPTWAPPLVLGEELRSKCIALKWLAPQDAPVARLWARFTNPKSGPVKCTGFELRVGMGRSKGHHKIFETFETYGSWWNGPRWNAKRCPLQAQATKLGASRVVEFAGNPEEQMRLGGVLAKACAICGRTLTDPISLETGIGPECIKAGIIIPISHAPRRAGPIELLSFADQDPLDEQLLDTMLDELQAGADQALSELLRTEPILDLSEILKAPVVS